MKNQPELNLRIPEDLLRKLLYVSEAEGRSPNNHILMLLRNNVQYFERAKGRIDQAKLRAIDLSEYEKTLEQILGDEVDQHGADEDNIFIPQKLPGENSGPPGGQRGEYQIEQRYLQHCDGYIAC